MSQTTKTDLLQRLEKMRSLVRAALDDIEKATERETVLRICAGLRDSLFTSPVLKALELIEDRTPEQLAADGDLPLPAPEPGVDTYNLNTPDGSSDFETP
jgi:hypothetical protein